MKWKKTIRHKMNEMLGFIQFVYDHFNEDDCMYRASALAFTSLLAVVPLMSVSFSILTLFPAFQNLSAPLQDFIFENFVPATGHVIQSYLLQFTAQVSRLSVVGILFLVGSALLVMVTIEQAMNRIWRVGYARHGVAAFLLYWSILSLAPVLLGLSVVASSYLISMPLIRNYEPSIFINYVPFVLSLFAFTFLYVVVPNCKVKIRHGVLGAFVAAVLFESAKHGFAYYLTQYDTYQLLYGAFAAIPIFFVWVYWVWLITLLGAEISYAFSVRYKRRPGHKLDGFSHALLWLNVLWEAQQQGKGLDRWELIYASSQAFDVDVDTMIKLLRKIKLIQITDDDEFILSRDLTDFTLYDLTQVLPYPLPSAKELEDIHLPDNPDWVSVLSEHNQLQKTALSIGLSELFKVQESKK